MKANRVALAGLNERKSRVISGLLLCATACITCYAQQSRPELTVKFEKPVYSFPVGTAMSLDVTLANISGQVVWFGISREDDLSPCCAHLLDATDHNVPKRWERYPTPYGHGCNVAEGLTSSKVVMPMDPGEILHRKFFLNNIFDIEHAGTYRLTVECRRTLNQGILDSGNTKVIITGVQKP